MIPYFLAALTAAALTAIALWRRPWRRRDDNLQAVKDWLEHFSPDSYLPMLRLADQCDTGFVTARGGTEQAARYRRVQREILREYLRVLSRDFHRLHAVATESALRARDDHGNLSLVLVEEKMEFIFSVWSIEIRLWLDEFAPCAVDLRPLLAHLEQLTAKARATARHRIGYRLT